NPNKVPARVENYQHPDLAFIEQLSRNGKIGRRTDTHDLVALGGKDCLQAHARLPLSTESFFLRLEESRMEAVNKRQPLRQWCDYSIGSAVGDAGIPIIELTTAELCTSALAPKTGHSGSQI